MKETRMNPAVTLVVGASRNAWRYSYRAVEELKEHGQPVIALGRTRGMIGDTEIVNTPPAGIPIDTVSLYLNSDNQKTYYDYILDLQPRRIIFNPGAENEELFQMALSRGIQPMNACTLVMLATGQF
jgi:predicted CoA-binding protein